MVPSMDARRVMRSAPIALVEGLREGQPSAYFPGEQRADALSRPITSTQERSTSMPRYPSGWHADLARLGITSRSTVDSADPTRRRAPASMGTVCAPEAACAVLLPRARGARRLPAGEVAS